MAITVAGLGVKAGEHWLFRDLHLAVVARPDPVVLFVLAAVLAAAAVPLLVRSGPPARPDIATGAGRRVLVDGWRDRVLRTTGVQFLDLAMLLPGALVVAAVVALCVLR